jgi:NAD-dependent dihydropyrimidine dehydrogenase PreA subunit/flavodoxin
MKFSVFYFSGTGNTKWAVNEFSNSINNTEHECNIYSIETQITNFKEIVNDADIIGFAFPLYGANIPNLVKNFIYKFKGNLNTTCKKQCFIITTAGYIDAYGPFTAGKILKPNGFKLVGYINIKMSNNISTPKIKADFLTSEKMKKRMSKGKDEIERLIYSLIHEKQYIRNIGLYLLPGVFIRKASENGKKNNYQALSVDKEKCSRCMACVNNCPTKSIIFSGKEFSFLPSCTSCMRCYNSCPKFAICHEGKYADPNIYKRYRGPQSIL